MMAKILVKIHSNGVVSVCDSDLIGRHLEENDIFIEISERFYKGAEKSEEAVVEILHNAGNVNIAGEKSIALALQAGIICEEGVRRIKGVPFAQIYSVA